MLKRFVPWLIKFLRYLFDQKPIRSPNLADKQKFVSPPELTNADLEFLFIELLEGVHQARGQQWAVRFLERMQNRITNQRWIDWLLDFGERLLMSPAPNNQLATRMVQLGELNIGSMGELAYEIGTAVLTRNLGESNQKENEQYVEKITHVENLEQISYADDEWLWDFYEQDSDTTTSVIQRVSVYEEGGLSVKNGQASDKVTTPTNSINLDFQSATIVLTHEERAPAPLEDAQALFYQGLQQARNGDLSEAIASYDKAIEINPDACEYWFNRGLILFYLEKFPSAIASYDRAIEIKPDFYKAWYNRGGAVAALGSFEDAIACFERAIEIKQDYHEAWFSRGLALLKLGSAVLAIASFDQALLLQPQDVENWYHRGIALSQIGQTNDAIASFETALEIQPDSYLAWYNRAIEFSRLGEYEEAIASYQQAIQVNPDFFEVWYAFGSMLDRLGRTSVALTNYERAIQINPNIAEVWIDQGVALASLKRWLEAISSWEKALSLKPDLYLAWFNSAVALENLERREDAIANYDKALEINPDFYLALYNKGVALFYSERFEEAIASYDSALQIKPDYWEAWIARGTAAGKSTDNFISFYSPLGATNSGLNERGYDGRLTSYSEGLKYVLQDTDPEGWGRLHVAIANTYYEIGKRHSTPRNYWYQALFEYQTASATLTVEMPSLHLEVLQNLIKTCVSLGETSQAQELQQYATDLLFNFLNEPTRSDESKKQLALNNACFDRLTVDICVQNGEIVEALEIAEHSKNACFAWLLAGWQEEIASPNYNSMKQLLNPTTAIIYWHISPCTLRTFILKHNSPEPIPVFTPVLNVAETEELPVPEAVAKLVEFEDWLEDWNQQYQQYCSQANNQQNKGNHSWEVHMENRLLKLKSILNIPAIEQELEDITQLILIPHLSLHKLPLHALFSPHFHKQKSYSTDSNVNEVWEKERVDDFTITYLPSIQTGLNLRFPSVKPTDFKLLSVEHPNSNGYPARKFAKLESEAMSLVFDNAKRILGAQATKDMVESALADDYNMFHFYGYESDNLNSPLKSALLLANDDELTLEEIFTPSISSYNLVTLSTCDRIISNQTITTEYVGLATGFLFQGVPHVVSTLWSIESAASTLVAIEFYRHIQRNESPVTALSKVTEWLKNLTAGELRTWYEDLLNNLPKERLRVKAHLATELYRSCQLPVDKKPYNHPYYWAAFKITGV
ncbi:MAG: tetratricopeptide repeat protein [Rhizonema sp. PD37]|nr:tetratricopeptide repeat protein [Rhizonema sp. PD37]